MSAIAEAFVRLRPDVTGFRAEAATGINAAVTGLGGSAGFVGIGKGALKASAGIVGITSAATLGAVALKEIVVGAGETERELDVLQVVSGATADEMARVSETARQLGADVHLPGVSAADAAVAMNELAKAGLSITDTMNGAKGALQLATAGEIAVGDAAALAGAALNTFGLQGDQATHVADLLAGASIVAQGTVGDMALALQQSGAVARQAGLSIEQTVGAIALLAKNGITGSDAGTSLRTMLLRLIPTTKEATQFVEALGISFDENLTLGEQLPEIIDQYAAALEKLPPALQQVALTQIFGSDAIRAASIFAREGAAGYERMAEGANRLGAAEDVATARTQGLLGTAGGLVSQLETLAQSLGEPLLGPLTDFTAGLADLVAGINSTITKMKELADVDLPEWLGGFDFGDAADFVTNNLPGSKELNRAKGAWNIATGIFRDGSEDVVRALTVAEAKAQTAKDRLFRLPEGGGMARQGSAIGVAFSQGVAGGIQQAGQSAVAAAQATLAQVVAAGRAAVAQAIAGAQQNLAGLGAQLASSAAQIIDTGAAAQGIEQATGRAAAAQSASARRRMNEAITNAKEELQDALRDAPIERQIRRLQDELDAANRRDDRRDVSRTLRDAKEELAEAQAQAQNFGPLTDRQAGQRRRFLRPFVEEVQDAKAEVSRFNKEATIDRLQKRIDGETDEIAENIGRLRTALRDAKDALVESQQSFSTGGIVNSLNTAAEAQKEAVRQGIADSIQEFNDGLITLPQLNKRLAKLLKDNGIDYKNAGKELGTAFVRGFEEILKGIGAQGAEILRGPKDPGAGLRAPVTSPFEAAQQAARDVAAAQSEIAANTSSAAASLDKIYARMGTGPNALTPSVAQETRPGGGSR